MPDLDDIVERAGRWTAGRHSRRSFLGKLGKATMLVAGGPALVATLMADDAEARVCGQSGVSPLCPTFDCDGVWGWCWYATGCCSGGLLKKICDCCAFRHPNVHGYCPPGHNVKCIVESCGTDPRLQTTRLMRLITDDPRAIADAARRHKFPNGSRLVVIGDAADPVLGGVATALAGLIQCPVIHVSRDGFDERDTVELDRLAATHVYIATPFPPPGFLATLALKGFAVEPLGTSDDPATFSGEIASWAQQVLGNKASVILDPADVTSELVALATGFAVSAFSTIVLGKDTQRSGGGVYLLGPNAIAHSSSLPGSVAISAPDIQALSTHLATMITREPGGTSVLAPVGSTILPQLATFGVPIVLHNPGTIDLARDWLIRNAAVKGGLCVLGGHRGSLGLAPLRELQSILNGYNVHSLVGVGGQGLPVISQPLAERPIGRARLGTDPPPGRR